MAGSNNGQKPLLYTNGPIHGIQAENLPLECQLELGENLDESCLERRAAYCMSCSATLADVTIAMVVREEMIRTLTT